MGAAQDNSRGSWTLMGKKTIRRKRQKVKWNFNQRVRGGSVTTLEMTPERRELLGDALLKEEGNYYLTEHWQSVKQRYYKRHPYECNKCGKTWGLHLHHKTYERLGRERDSDLMYLCRNCHQRLHTKERKAARRRRGASKKQGNKPKKKPYKSRGVFTVFK